MIQKIDEHPWNQLRALKQRMTSADNARRYELKVKYHNLRNGSGNQDIEKYLDSWQMIYIEGRELHVKEILDTRPIRDFIFVIMKKDHTWTTAQLTQKTLMKKEENFQKILKNYRLYAKMTHSYKTNTYSHSTFSADANTNSNETLNSASNQPNQRSQSRDGRTNFREQNQPSKYLCGVIHYWARCYYLNLKKRSSNWSSNDEVANKINETLKNVNLKKKIEAAIKNSKDYEKKQANKSKQNTLFQKAFAAISTNAFSFDLDDDNLLAIFVVAQSAAYSTYEYPLLSSWILDNGSDTHICNSTMAHRYKKTRDVENESVLTDNVNTKVHSYEEIDIFMTGPQGEWKVTLTNVCYVSNFFTNVVSARILRKKGVYFNDEELFLRYEEKVVAYVKHKHRHDLLKDYSPDDHDENNSASTQHAAAAAAEKSSKSDTANDWHELLTHANNDVIQ